METDELTWYLAFHFLQFMLSNCSGLFNFFTFLEEITMYFGTPNFVFGKGRKRKAIWN